MCKYNRATKKIKLLLYIFYAFLSVMYLWHSGYHPHVVLPALDSILGCDYFSTYLHLFLGEDGKLAVFSKI